MIAAVCVPVPVVFRTSVALAQGEPLGAPSPQAAPMLAMPRGLILVIDDDPVIQSAMRSLLSSWGHDVIVAGSYRCSPIPEALIGVSRGLLRHLTVPVLLSH